MHRDMHPNQVEIIGTDMAFGQMVLFAFKWLLAFGIACLPFIAVIVIADRLAS